MSKQLRPRAAAAMAALAAVAVLVLLLFAANEGSTSASDLAVPSLFAGAASCAVSGEQAHLRAEQTERDARARWERAPYAAGDATLAVLALEEAGECFRVSGDRTGRARMEKDLFAWRRELERVYARARLRLTLALRAERFDEAVSEAQKVRMLLAKAGPAADPYRAYLTSVERSARAAQVEQARNAEEE